MRVALSRCFQTELRRRFFATFTVLASKSWDRKFHTMLQETFHPDHFPQEIDIQSCAKASLSRAKPHRKEAWTGHCLIIDGWKGNICGILPPLFFGRSIDCNSCQLLRKWRLSLNPRCTLEILFWTHEELMRNTCREECGGKSCLIWACDFWGKEHHPGHTLTRTASLLFGCTLAAVWPILCFLEFQSSVACLCQIPHSSSTSPELIVCFLSSGLQEPDVMKMLTNAIESFGSGVVDFTKGQRIKRFPQLWQQLVIYLPDDKIDSILKGRFLLETEKNSNCFSPTAALTRISLVRSITVFFFVCIYRISVCILGVIFLSFLSFVCMIALISLIHSHIPEGLKVISLYSQFLFVFPLLSPHQLQKGSTNFLTCSKQLTRTACFLPLLSRKAAPFEWKSVFWQLFNYINIEKPVKSVFSLTGSFSTWEVSVHSWAKSWK